VTGRTSPGPPLTPSTILENQDPVEDYGYPERREPRNAAVPHHLMLSFRGPEVLHDIQATSATTYVTTCPRVDAHVHAADTD